MFSMKKDKLLFKQLEQWIEEKEDDKVKFIIEHTAPTDRANESDETLLHVAASRGNLKIMEYLEKVGIHIDVRDAFYTTPLMLAISNRQWEAATFLLEHGADIFAKNSLSDTPLSKLMKMDEPDLKVLKIFFDKVRAKNPDAMPFFCAVAEAGCTLDKLIHVHDKKVTGICLAWHKNYIEREVEFASVSNAMRTMDAENMDVLMNWHEPGGRREDFVICLRDVLLDSQHDESLAEVVKVAVEQLVGWKLLNNITVHFLELIFHEVPEVCLRRILRDDLVSYIKDTFNYDIRVHMFGNRNPCVLKMIQNGEANMNALSRKGRTALHIATKEGAVDTMKYLLDCGVDPNIKDNNGKTPIFKVFNQKERLSILLMYGADLQACDDSGGTMLDSDTPADQNWNEMLEVIAAHLAILASTDKPLTKAFFSYLLLFQELYNIFRLCEEQLEKMKKHVVHGSLTFYETLTENLENLARRVKSFDHETIEIFFTSISAEKYNSYYVLAARERLEKAVTISNLRDRAMTVIGDNIEMLKPYYLVIDKICSFLTYYDLSLFAEP